MDPVNMLFTFFINLGALVVYTVIVNSMAEFQYNLNLEEEKKEIGRASCRERVSMLV